MNESRIKILSKLDSKETDGIAELVRKELGGDVEQILVKSGMPMILYAFIMTHLTMLYAGGRISIRSKT